MVDYISLDKMKKIVLDFDDELQNVNDDDKLSKMAFKLDEFEYIKDKINFIRTYINVNETRVKGLINTKKRLESEKDYKALNDVKSEIKSIKRNLKLIRSLEIEFKNSPRVKNKKRSSYKDLLIDMDNVRRLDVLMNTNNYDELVKLNETDDLTVKLEKLNSIKNSILKRQHILKNLYNIALKDNCPPILEEVKKLKRTKTLLLNYLDKYIAYVNRELLSTAAKNKDYSKVFGNSFVLNDRQRQIKELILDGSVEQCSNDSVDDLLIAFRDIILNGNINSNKQAVSLFIDYLNERVGNDDTYIWAIIDMLKHKKRKLGKEKSYEKTLIKNYIEKLRNILIVNDDTPFFEEDLVNYEIFSYLLDNSSSYYYIKNLISKDKNLLNLRHNDRHIIVDIFSRYVESSKEELRNRGKDYVAKEYYKNLYNLFRRSEGIELFREDLDEIEKIFDDFIVYLGGKKYNPELKSKAVIDINDMLSTSNCEHLKLNDEINDYLNYTKAIIGMVPVSNRVVFDSKALNKVKNKIEEYEKEFEKKYSIVPSRELVCQELGITTSLFDDIYSGMSVDMVDKKHAFSLSSDIYGNSYLKMHVLDMTSVIKDNDLLDDYLLSNVGNGNIDIASFSVGGTYPTITYELKVCPNGYVGNFDVYRSQIVIDERINDVSDYKDNSSSKKYVRLYRMLSKHRGNINIKEIDNYFLDLMNSGIISYAGNLNIPIIMNGINNYDASLAARGYTDLGQLFSKLDDRKYAMYVAAFDKNLDESHYVNESYDSGKFSYSFTSCNSYIDLFNQRVLLGYLNNLEDYREKSNNIVCLANANIGYVDISKERKYVKMVKEV